VIPVSRTAGVKGSPIRAAQNHSHLSFLAKKFQNISIWILNIRIELYLGDDTNLKEQGA